MVNFDVWQELKKGFYVMTVQSEVGQLDSSKFSIWTNTVYNMDKYLLQAQQIQKWQIRWGQKWRGQMNYYRKTMKTKEDYDKAKNTMNKMVNRKQLAANF